MAAAEDALEDQVGHVLETVSISSSDQTEAVFLGQNISKLSPLIGNLMELRIVQSLAAREVEHHLQWIRQDPYFPDAALFNRDGTPVGAGFEIKAWYCLSTELTGRFRESVNLLAGKDIRLLIVAWAMSHVVLGQPEILGVLSVPAESVARERDAHYHAPPTYLIVEPEDTTDRTANLQQSNVNGYRLQGMPSPQAMKLWSESAHREAEPHTAEAQTVAYGLQNIDRYRLDTNFAKIDRIDHADIEGFKTKILGTHHQGRSISGWVQTLKDLHSTDSSTRKAAEAEIAALYESVKSSA